MFSSSYPRVPLRSFRSQGLWMKTATTWSWWPTWLALATLDTCAGATRSSSVNSEFDPQGFQCHYWIHWTNVVPVMLLGPLDHCRFSDGGSGSTGLMWFCAADSGLGGLHPSRAVGLKYEKAKEWKIPCVNAQWLCDILLGNFDALRQIQHSRYSVFTHPEPLAPNSQLVHNLLGT